MNTISIEQLTEIGKMVGLLVAGFWTAWTFHRLHRVRAAELANNKTLTEIEKGRIDIEKSRTEIEKSRIDIEKARMDIEKSRIDAEKGKTDIEKSLIEQREIRERLRSQQPQLAIQLDVSESESSDPNFKAILAISVILKNEGAQNLWVGMNQYNLTIGRFEFTKDGKQRLLDASHFMAMYFPEKSTELKIMPSRILRAGQTRKVALALMPITAFGSYLIQFNATYAGIPSTRGETLNIEATEQTFYIATGKTATFVPAVPLVQDS
jgi:hypothetical protein